MSKHLHYHNDSYAAGFFGDLLEAVIEVARTPPKPEPPKRTATSDIARDKKRKATP